MRGDVCSKAESSKLWRALSFLKSHFIYSFLFDLLQCHISRSRFVHVLVFLLIDRIWWSYSRECTPRWLPACFAPVCIQYHTHTYLYAHSTTHIHTYMHTVPHTYIPICIQYHTHTYLYAYSTTHIHTYMHTVPHTYLYASQHLRIQLIWCTQRWPPWRLLVLHQ
jgi:hypothetical protein